MAGILQNLFVRALNPESVRSLKMVMSHASLYFGIILYTAVGAKVLQLMYLFIGAGDVVVVERLVILVFGVLETMMVLVMTQVSVYCCLRKCSEFDTLQC